MRLEKYTQLEYLTKDEFSDELRSEASGLRFRVVSDYKRDKTKCYNVEFKRKGLFACLFRTFEQYSSFNYSKEYSEEYIKLTKRCVDSPHRYLKAFDKPPLTQEEKDKRLEEHLAWMSMMGYDK